MGNDAIFCSEEATIVLLFLLAVVAFLSFPGGLTAQAMQIKKQHGVYFSHFVCTVSVHDKVNRISRQRVAICSGCSPSEEYTPSSIAALLRRYQLFREIHTVNKGN